MKIGTQVKHKMHGWVGIVASEIGKYGGVMVNLSNKQGIKFRRIHISNLEIVDECRG